jgi:hypothetical protein
LWEVYLYIDKFWVYVTFKASDVFERLALLAGNDRDQQH